MTKIKGAFDRSLIRRWDVYLIRNPIGQVYIGLTSNFYERIRTYKSGHCKRQSLLSDSFCLHGFNSHDIRIIDSFISDGSFADQKEIFWVRIYMSNVNQWPDEKGLNICGGGGGRLGVPSSEKQKDFMRSRKGTYNLSEEAKKAIGLSKIGNKNMVGRKLEKATKDKIKEKAICRIGKPVLQYDFNGNFIKEYPAKRVAHKETGISRNALNDQLEGRTKNPEKYIFKYKP